MLLPAQASAAPASSLFNKIVNQSSSNQNSAKSVIDPAAHIEEISKKLVAAKAELALMPSEAAADSTSIGLTEDEFIIAQRLRLRQLVFHQQNAGRA
ncbi:MAG: hypothetical protein ACXW1Z_21110 [Methylobacter sp.]